MGCAGWILWFLVFVVLGEVESTGGHIIWLLWLVLGLYIFFNDYIK